MALIPRYSRYSSRSVSPAYVPTFSFATLELGSAVKPRTCASYRTKSSIGSSNGASPSQSNASSAEGTRATACGHVVSYWLLPASFNAPNARRPLNTLFA